MIWIWILDENKMKVELLSNSIPQFIYVWINKYFLNLVEMDDKVTVARTVNSWSCLESGPQSILLIGPSHTGRTTFAELVRKYLYGISSPALAYDNGKYNLEGVISNKSIKIQTSYPALYEKSKKDKQELRLVDVPSFIYPPENKKWGPLEQKLTADLLVAKSNKVGFLLFIEQKSTRTNIIPWKKALLSFLDLFRPECLTDDLLDSIGMAITKAPPEIKEETMVARLKQMKQTLQKEKCPLIPAVDRLFKNMIEKNRIIIFKKVTGDDSEKDSILGNWSQLQKMANYNITREHIKEQQWQPDAQKAVLEYFGTVDNSLKQLASLVKDLLGLPDFSSDRLREVKKKREGLQDVVVSEQVKQRLSIQDAKGVKYLSFVQRYAQLAREYSEITPTNIEQFISAIIKLSLFSEPEDYSLFQAVFEGLQFKRIEDFRQFQIEPHCRSFAQLFSQEMKVEVFRKLSLAELGNERKEFYEEAIQMIRSNFAEPPAPLQQFQQDCKKKLIKFANPKQALKLYAEELAAEKNKSKQYALISDVALILRNKGLLAQAGMTYRAGRNAGAALQCLRQAVMGDQRVAKEYISYLSELTLFQQAIAACYDLAARFGFQSRAGFEDILKGVDAARMKYLKEGLKVNSFSQQLDVKAAIKVANESKEKL